MNKIINIFNVLFIYLLFILLIFIIKFYQISKNKIKIKKKEKRLK